MINMIPLPHAPKIVSKENQKAVFEIEALYPGYGVTLGNSLRRVLLSSLEGNAATQVKIKGVQHEFSTIPGVLEDLTLITLNLKQLRFKVFGDEPQKATLKVKGEKDVKGKDLVLPPQVELMNKDVKIATLTSKSAELDLEISIEKGLGYRSREARKKQEKLEVGAIPLDAIFTPVRRVGFRVENMRVGERTDYDRLFLEVETDGTISPEQALERASDILLRHFSLIAETYKQKVEEPKEPKAVKSPKGAKKAKTLRKHAEKKKGKKAK
ncbi:MAG: DNA-directed RNA polymerase subunit alpha [Parcubacteria group bacterium Gr01-1014_30]|nr:MAG: DNA-directed RNA polymerase subunit alpha [Parcubacteria group bacterium Gr01-1014_30]